MTPFLPPKCLCKIFQNLTDQETLYSCLFVNRLWCAISVEFLWSKPFHFIHTCRKSLPSISLSSGSTFRNNNNNKSISSATTSSITSTSITSTSSCLSSDEKTLLMESGIELSDDLLQSPLFDYAEFIKGEGTVEVVEVGGVGGYKISPKLKKKSSIKKFRLSNVVKFITKTINNHRRGYGSNHDHQARRNSESSYYSVASSFDTTCTSSSSTPSKRLITEFLCQLIMRKCPALRQLSIDRIDLNRSEIYSSKDELFRCSTLRAQLSDRFQNRLIPEQYLLLPIYPGATRALESLNELIVTTQLEDESKSLAILINSQKALKQFDLYCCEIGSSIIMNSLKSQTQSLKSITFNDIKFWKWDSSSLDFLGDCLKLEKLIFNSCHGLTEELLNSMIDVKYQGLNTIIMENSITPVNILGSVIINSMDKIRTINLGHSTYCSQLRNFSSYIDSEDLNQLFNLFTSCKNLETVTIYGPISSEIETTNLLLRLSQQELPNLRSLSIQAAWKFTSLALDQFLINSKPSLKYLEFRNSRCFNDKHLKVIIKNLGKELNILKLHITEPLNEELVGEAKREIELRGRIKDLRNSEVKRISSPLRKQRGFGSFGIGSFGIGNFSFGNFVMMMRGGNLVRIDKYYGERRDSQGNTYRFDKLGNFLQIDSEGNVIVVVEDSDGNIFRLDNNGNLFKIDRSGNFCRIDPEDKIHSQYIEAMKSDINNKNGGNVGDSDEIGNGNSSRKDSKDSSNNSTISVRRDSEGSLYKFDNNGNHFKIDRYGNISKVGTENNKDKGGNAETTVNGSKTVNTFGSVGSVVVGDSNIGGSIKGILINNSTNNIQDGLVQVEYWEPVTRSLDDIDLCFPKKR
ncbi:6083_t:CDS:10 [Diversispora eburnea]|uniref:6083_t:CDS:1 n=1 Tax=Diversispora eburnea TaxID=1213867 RepID=A0A9N8UZC6_9GLOM|nr:6083_t:CDS:10 [Diversispora eburnea]